jgi:hypothetical protein
MSVDVQSHQSKIQQWMEHVQITGGVERYDDLHIDLIDETWKNREMWISGGITALTLASSIRNAIDSELVVVLGMSLRTDLKNSCIPNTASDLFEQLDQWTPPSLYLFRSGEEPWHHSRCNCRFVEGDFGHEDQQINGIYLEFASSHRELRRSFYMIRGNDLHRKIEDSRALTS